MDDTTAGRLYKAYYESEIGTIEIACSGRGLTSLAFVEEVDPAAESGEVVCEPLKQVEEYFQGTRQVFSLDLDLQGTEFEKEVWRELLEIPFGQTRSYGDIATALGNIKAVRAVGRANGRNTIAIVVPCHRVIGSDRSLTGYAGGLWRKQWLLNHEMRAAGILLPF
jgi:methylated-DNA-[protein]-cysteine S-methyltransferase